MSKIAFLGLGTMGRGMVVNLLKAGHDVAVWNRSPEAAAELVPLGAHAESTPAAAAAGRQFVMYCLADDRAIQDVILAPGGVAAAAEPGSTAIDLSTVDPQTSALESAAFGARKIDFLDAPVFGSKAEAESGRVWPVVGGAEAVFERAQEVLEPISESVHYMGGAGNGTRMKLVGNLLVALQFQALGEALTLAKKSGLVLDDVLSVIGVTSFKSPLYNEVGSAVLVGNYEPSFALKLLLKDARLISSLARRLDVNVPATEVALRTIERAVESGWGQQNASALVKVLAHDANVHLEA